VRQFVVSPETLVAGWGVTLNGSPIGLHFTQGLAIAHALNEARLERRAGRRAEVQLKEHSGRVVVLLPPDVPSPTRPPTIRRPLD